MDVSVKVNPKLSRALQELAYKLGWRHTTTNATYVKALDFSYIVHRKSHQNKEFDFNTISINAKEISVEDWISLLKGEKTLSDFDDKKYCVLDGKKIELSEESYNNLKKGLGV